MSLCQVGDKNVNQSPSHTLCEKEQISKLKSFVGASCLCTAWVSFDPELITQTIAEAKESRAIVLSYLYLSVGNNMKILLRKRSSSLLQGMYIVWVPRALKPDAGRDDPLEELKGSMLEFNKKGEVWEESLCPASPCRETFWSASC